MSCFGRIWKIQMELFLFQFILNIDMHDIVYK